MVLNDISRYDICNCSMLNAQCLQRKFVVSILKSVFRRCRSTRESERARQRQQRILLPRKIHLKSVCLTPMAIFGAKIRRRFRNVWWPSDTTMAPQYCMRATPIYNVIRFQPFQYFAVRMRCLAVPATLHSSGMQSARW